MENTKKKSFNNYFERNREGKLETLGLTFDCYFDNIRVAEREVNGQTKKVANIRVYTYLPDRLIEKYFKDVTQPGKALTVDIGYWGAAAENLEKYPPAKNQRIECDTYGFRIEDREHDGKVYKNVRATGNGFVVRRSAGNRDGEAPATSAPAATAAAPAEFEELDDFAEEGLPF